MTRRLRVVLPINSLVGFLFAYALLELPFWLLRGAIVMPISFRRPSLVLLCFGAVVYGKYRVIAFHPFYRPDYREWLSRTPWTHRKPLPVGPVEWGWEDSLVFAVLAGLCWLDHHQLDPVVMATLPFLSYGLFLTIPLFMTGAVAFGYVTLFVLGLAIWLAPNHRAFLGTAIAADLIAYVGFKRSLAGFPWSLAWQATFPQRIYLGEKPGAAACGWPYNRLSPEAAKGARIGLSDALLISMTVGWWVFALTSLIPDPSDRVFVLTMILVLGTWVFCAGRMLLYCNGYDPPISLWGRLVTFRWIIPGYDLVFVGPAFSVLSAGAGFITLWRWGVPQDVGIPVSLALMMFVSMSCKPSLERWRLTGRHRIKPIGATGTSGQAGEFVRVG